MLFYRIFYKSQLGLIFRTGGSIKISLCKAGTRLFFLKMNAALTRGVRFREIKMENKNRERKRREFNNKREIILRENLISEK